MTNATVVYFAHWIISTITIFVEEVNATLPTKFHISSPLEDEFYLCEKQLKHELLHILTGRGVSNKEEWEIFMLETLLTLNQPGYLLFYAEDKIAVERAQKYATPKILEEVKLLQTEWNLLSRYDSVYREIFNILHEKKKTSLVK